ncbi:hypothetical protein [Amycolatopsis sp. WGS_07]|uniref:hypothetical protein n=1 Tax=Amycolatopsis sp. WGS_07 TaxID=3076764 RepID=UPI003872EAAE
MLYRICPPAAVTWCDIPGGRTLDLVRERPEADLENLPWLPAEARGFSNDLLRIAVRHGVPTRAGIVLDVVHTLDLGRADELRSSQIRLDDAQAKLRASTSMQMIERMFPGSIGSGERLDEDVRKATEKVAREAEQDLAEVLAAPVQPDLVAHWRRLGGHYPD